MDEININEDILSDLLENSLEATLQERILKQVTSEPIDIIHKTVNEAVMKMA